MAGIGVGHDNRWTAVFGMHMPNPIHLLVVLHCLVTVGSAVLLATATRNAAALVYVALVLSQASLLGMWMALGRTHFAFRSLAAVVGIFALGFALGSGIHEVDTEWFVLVALVMIFVAGVVGLLRLLGIRAFHLAESSATSTRDLQFTIRQLMLATLIVACLLGIGRALAPFLPPARVITFGLALAICFAAVAVSALWGTLGIRNVEARITAASLVAVVTAGIVYYVVEVTQVDPGSIWFTIVLAYSALMIISLIAVRFSGYRIARISRRSQG